MKNRFPVFSSPLFGLALVIVTIIIILAILVGYASQAGGSPTQSPAPSRTEVPFVVPSVVQRVYTPSATPPIPSTSTLIPPTVPIDECQVLKTIVNNAKSAEEVIDYLERSGLNTQVKNGQKIEKVAGKTTVVWSITPTEIDSEYAVTLKTDETGTVLIVKAEFIVLQVSATYRVIEEVCSFE